MAGPACRIHLCGQLRVEVAGEPREEAIRGRQGRLLLAFLVVHRHRPVTRDELVEALWAGDGRPPSQTALAPVLSRLRRALEPAAIEGRDSLVLRLPEPAWLDVEAVGELLAEGRAALAADPAAALQGARAAAALAAPGVLPGLEAPWLDEVRATIADLHVEALELLATAGARAGGADLPPAEDAARAAVAAAPFRESARVALIEVLRAQGNFAEALRAYEDVRTLLREELGTAPGPELIALHGRLLDGDAPAAAPAPAPARATARPRPADAAPAGLVEREAELGEVDAAVARLMAGHGGVLLIEGPAGIGKTALLTELGRRAAADGARVLGARAGLLEREYGFGVARQLLARAATEPGVLDGPAAAARAVVAETAGSAGEDTFATLDGLHHLTAAVAARQPLVLAVDDLQWSDPASLRFVAYLARRVETLPVLVATTVRTGEPGSEQTLLDELAQDAATVALRPRPLTPEATAALVRARLGEGTEDVFAAACQEVTAGNPLLVGQLLTALAAEAVAPDAEHAERVRAVGPRAVSRTVLLRLARLPAGAVAVAQAVAVLGERPSLAAIAAMARIGEDAAAQALQALVRAEILRPDEALGFVHPLVRDAVYNELPAAGRGLEHARAARILADLGASPESVAAQLLLAPPRADPWVVDRLREAADIALRRGAPDASLALLTRAQAEPPPAEARAALALELGGSAAYLRGPAGVEPLRQAYTGLTDPAERGRAAIRLSHLLLFVSSPQEAVALARRATDELPAELDDLRQGLLAVRLVGVAFGADDDIDPDALDAVRRGPRGDGPGARALTAMAALWTALSRGPAEEASALAHEALEIDGLQGFEITAPVALATAVLTLGEPADGLRAIVRYTQHARRQGEILGSIGADLWGGLAHLWAGDLRAAIESLERAHEGERLWGTKLDAVMAYSAAFVATAWLERGDPVRARSELHRVEASDGISDGAAFWHAAHAELLLAEGRHDEALAVTHRLEGFRAPDTHPIWAPWRGLRARALAGTGRRDEALALARDELDLARRMAAPWAVGRALRLLAELEGADGVEHAREAVALLTSTSARLELAKAHAALGDALAAAGEAAAAPACWAAALELARAGGAEGLAERVASALDGAGR